MERRKFLETEWSPKNEKQFSNYGNGNGFSAVWEHLCQCGEKHIWKAPIYHRMNGTNCPYCAGRKLCKCKSLSNLRPDLALEWHPTKNKILPENVALNHTKRVWWLCNKSKCTHKHEWENSPNSRVWGETGCPFCSGRTVCPCNSIKSLNPDFFKEWDPKNKEDPSAIALNSGKKIWWICYKHKCDNVHKWQARVVERNHGRNCPYCCGKKVCDCNSFANKFPELLKEWHEKNEFKPSQVTAGSKKKILWKCENNHEWEATICNRTCGDTACPFCNFSKGEKTIEKFLKQKGLVYITQKKINLKSLFNLYLDFYLPDLNKAIEFDGSQHFAPVEFFGGEEAFKKQHVRDRLKEAYCAEKGISLLRIHHKDFDSIKEWIEIALDFKLELPFLMLSDSYPLRNLIF